MADPVARPSRSLIGRMWFATIWTLAFGVGAIAFFVRGIVQGWTLAALLLNGVAIVIFVGALAAQITALRHLYRRRHSQPEARID